MKRPKTTKELASRIDPQYIRGSSFSGRVRILSLVLVAVAIGLWFVMAPRERQLMANPGPVSEAHAMWESDCAKCHDSDGHGGFRRTVSDSACLQCHAAPAHRPHELMREGVDAHNPLALAVKDGTGKMRSANCTSCHIEHRGHVLLAAVADSNCTRCHANIKAATDPKYGRNMAMIDTTQFNATGGHPAFGRHLLRPGASLPTPPASIDPGILFDPTHLKFNHKTHMGTSADPAHGVGVNCTICHVNHNRAPVGNDARKTTEPFSAGDGQYMRPVSYASDCQSCHPLILPGGAVLPHAGMEIVQGKLLHPEDFYRDWLARLTPAKRADALGDKDADQWVKDSASTLRGNAGDWVGGLEKAKKVMDGAPKLEDAIVTQFSLDAGSSIDPAEAGKDIRVVSAYVAYAKNFTGRCSLCHEVREMNTAAATQLPPASAPADTAPVAAPTTSAAVATTPTATAPAAAPDAAAPAAAPDASGATQPAGPVAVPVLATVPTGIPDVPRRWFIGSRFDHKAHQNVSCVSCHSRAPTSTETSDVLSPNLTWTEPGGATVSCADCHHATNAKGSGAVANCVTCHTFHDRSVPTKPVERRDVSVLAK